MVNKNDETLKKEREAARRLVLQETQATLKNMDSEVTQFSKTLNISKEYVVQLLLLREIIVLNEQTTRLIELQNVKTKLNKNRR